MLGQHDPGAGFIEPEQMHRPLLGRLMLQGASEGFAIQVQMGFFGASILVDQPTRLPTAPVLGLLLGKKMGDHVGQFLGIHMTEHLAGGGNTGKACTG